LIYIFIHLFLYDIYLNQIKRLNFQLINISQILENLKISYKSKLLFRLKNLKLKFKEKKFLSYKNFNLKKSSKKLLNKYNFNLKKFDE
jgi:hypothetical protein